MAIYNTVFSAILPICSGVLLKDSDPKDQPIVVSTASCLKNFQPGTYFAEKGGMKCNILQIMRLESNLVNIFNYDIAVLRFDGCPFIVRTEAIEIISKDDSVNYGSQVKVSGWNMMKDASDLKTRVETVLDGGDCFESFSQKENVVDAEVFCMGIKEEGGRYLCEAQGGSPVVTQVAESDLTLVGLASWTYVSSHNET